jgi:serine protease Do
LFDTQGHVIGINTAIYSPSGGNVGIGFAIPSNMAEDVVAQLKVNGEVTRGWLGVQIQAVTQEVADSLGLEKAQGVIVASVVKNSPASTSGIKPGDIITALDDKPVDDIKDLTKLVAGISVGSGVVLKLQRDGGTQLIEVIIGSMPGEEVELAQVEDGSAADESELGLQLASLTPENRKQFKLAENSSGVLVAGVKTSSPASKAGIRPGFVINMVGQKPVASPGDFIERVRHAAENKQSAVLLRVEYRGENRFVTVKLATA